jgi:hypothetical protein
MPLPFIASFDCAALPRVEDLPLPADGSLLFFRVVEGTLSWISRCRPEHHAAIVQNGQ